MVRLSLMLAVLFCFASSSAQEFPPQTEGVCRDIPIHVMEFHLWWSTPFQGPLQNRVWSKWTWSSDNCDPRLAVGPAWRRRLSSSALPLIGPYSSSDPEVMRWQLRCAKAAGIDALQIQLFPTQSEGTSFGQEEAFAHMLDIAAQEKMPIYIHDEVQFRKPPASTPLIMEKRIVYAINKFGSHPGYFRWNGKPAYSFQYWRRFISEPDMALMLKQASTQIPGGIHFMVNGGGAVALRQIPDVGSLIVTGNSNQLRTYNDRSGNLDWSGIDKRLADAAQTRQAGPFKPSGYWAYAGFDAAAQQNGKGRWLSRGNNLSTLAAVVERYLKEKPDFLMLSSWNDWNENTALEPSLDVDGRNEDPYQALRFIAHLKGKKFIPPPLPAPDHVDPWMSVRLGGKDMTPPYELRTWFAPNSQEVRMTFADETSPVTNGYVAREATAFIDWSAQPVQSRNLSTSMTLVRAQSLDDISGIDLGSELTLKVSGNFSIMDNDPTWLAVTYYDAGNGALLINYPTNQPLLVEPTDGVSIPPRLKIRLKNERRWRCAVLELRGINAHFSGGEILITHEKKTSRPDMPALNDPVVLGGCWIFRRSDFSSNETFDAGHSVDKGTITFRFRQIPWDPLSARPFLFIAGDINRNESFPVAIIPGIQKDALFRIYK